jgi:hypothetical protein
LSSSLHGAAPRRCARSDTPLVRFTRMGG